MRLCVYAAFSLSIQRRERINIRVHKEGDETCPYCRPEKHERGEKSKPFQSKKRIETSSPLCPNLSIYVRINIGKEGWSMNRNGISTTVLINSSTPDDFLFVSLIRKKKISHIRILFLRKETASSFLLSSHIRRNFSKLYLILTIF